MIEILGIITLIIIGVFIAIQLLHVKIKILYQLSAIICVLCGIISILYSIESNYTGLIWALSTVIWIFNAHRYKKILEDDKINL